MTQQVFDNGMTAHVWAQQRQESGRSHNGNFFFSGRSIYSYGSHYVAGYVAPGPLYLVNGDDSTMTTKGKHLPAVRRAIDYGRGAFSNSATVPSLGDIAHIFDGLCCNRLSKAEAQRQIARQIESGPADWPGPEAAARLYVAAGMAPGKAQSKAEAGGKRVERAEAKRKAAAARRALDQEARCAKGIFARDTPQRAAHVVRGLLQEAASESRWGQERKEAEAAEESRDYFRAAKAAKAKGWTRIAAHCRACYQATRVELKRYQAAGQRYQERAACHSAIHTLRGMAESLRAVAVESQYKAWGSDKTAELTAAEKAKRAQAIAGAYAAQIDAARTITGSPFAWAAGAAGLGRLNRLIDGLERLKAQSLAIAGQHMQAAQAEARESWLAGGSHTAQYSTGRLVDSEGGALLRAEAIERDDSGQITGGILRTSWGATVPLAHAIRAFQFLKLCRQTGRAWQANGHTIRVGHFRVDSIDANGNFRAACHRINWQEVSRLAESLGLAELAATDSALESSRTAA